MKSDSLKTSLIPAVLLCCLVIVCVPVASTVADVHSPQWEDDDNSYDQARRAVSRGEALPIEEVLKRLKTQIPGQVIEIEFEFEHGHWVYEFKMIDDEGRRLEAYLDAKTGELISVEGR